MSEVFNIELEIDLSEFDSTVTDGGDLSWSSSGLAGTSGKMSCLIDDTTAIYGVKGYTQLTSTSYRFRFYIDPNNLIMGEGESFRVCMIAKSSNFRADVLLRMDSGNYKVSVRVYDDNGATRQTSNYTITDAEHYIEVLVTYASGESANDGVLTLWIDGVQQESVTNVDLYNTTKPDSSRIGAVAYLDAGTSGTFYLDEFVLRDDATEIGAVATGNYPWYAYAQQQ